MNIKFLSYFIVCSYLNLVNLKDQKYLSHQDLRVPPKKYKSRYNQSNVFPTINIKFDSKNEEN